MVNKFIFLVLLVIPAMASEEYDLYKTARGHWFDSNWEEASKAYKTLVEKYPDSRLRCKAENYLGYCYKNMDKPREAFKVFQHAITTGRCGSDSLVDARSEVVNLAFLLIKEDPSMKKVIKNALSDENVEIRFNAAVKLAMLGDTSGMGIFFDVVENDTDQDLRELAIDHILRYANAEEKARLEKLLDTYQEANKGKKAKMIRLVVRNLQTNDTEIKVKLPINLVQTAISMLDKEQLAFVEKEANMDLSNLSKLNLEDMAPGTVLFKVTEGRKKEYKLFLE